MVYQKGLVLERTERTKFLSVFVYLSREGGRERGREGAGERQRQRDRERQRQTVSSFYFQISLWCLKGISERHANKTCLIHFLCKNSVIKSSPSSRCE